MFSIRQKREIADKVQAILRETNHPELPPGEIYFTLHVRGAESWSWADIRNNENVPEPEVNPWNEKQDSHCDSTISDGFGNQWVAECRCGGDMEIVRPGKVQCGRCG
jgi:hypothetical protein